MKKIITAIVCCIATLTLAAQTEYQRRLLREYFNETGCSLLKKYAQPVNDIIDKEVWVYDNAVYIKIYYKANFFSNYYDTYRIRVDAIGKFTELEVTNDGATFVSAFEACNFARESFSDWLNKDYQGTPSEKRDLLSYAENAVGKSLSYFDCKDICFYQLYYYWRKYGYYSKY
ncbi:MAG: hypothetical protein KIS94_06080 [Chitinophagales bacterium]|nr:hypothetical protein [Chitinophagales bacterium]